MRSFNQDNSESTIINSVTQFKGIIKGTGKICVQGVVQGEIVTEGEVNIEPNGRVEGHITATNVIVHGHLVGNIKIFNSLFLAKSSKMEGDADIGKLSVEEGAIYCGKISMKKTT